MSRGPADAPTLDKPAYGPVSGVYSSILKGLDLLPEDAHRCIEATSTPEQIRKGLGGAGENAEAALAIWYSKRDGRVTQTILSVPDDLSVKLISQRIPVECRKFSTMENGKRVGVQLYYEDSGYYVPNPPGSANKSRMITWKLDMGGKRPVVYREMYMYGRGYLMVITLFGASNSRVANYARDSLIHADAILR